MDKRLKLIRCIMLLLVFVAVAYGVAMCLRSVSQKQKGQEMLDYISTLSFSVDESDQELEGLLKFAEDIPSLSNRDAAKYYGTMTKLYMLRADADNALLTFIDSFIQAELCKAYDVIAWLFADTAQVYIDFFTYDLAIECIDSALRYGECQPMDDFFYEYCYLTLAELYARKKEPSIDKAKEYYEKSLEADSVDMPEYQSMDMRRHLVLANIALLEGDNKSCTSHLDVVGDTIDALDYPPIDVLWASGIYYPYLEMRAKAALENENYEELLYYMDSMFAAGNLYGQTGSLMNSLSDIVATFKEINDELLSSELRMIIQNYTQKLVLEYPGAFQEKNIIAGTHIYNSNMATILAIVQRYNTERFYKLVAQCAIAAACLIVSLILVWQKSERKGRVDGLTGAYNRKYFNHTLESLQSGRAAFGIIMYDIDFFKQINDGYGHEAGDMVLRDITSLTMRLLGHDSRLYRYGGDEFCIIAKYMTVEQLAALAERIRKEAEELRWEVTGLRATLSMGVAHSSEGQDVMAVVDERLYKSKEAGRNFVSWN